MIKDIYSIAYSPVIELASMEEVQVDLELERTHIPSKEAVIIKGCVRNYSSPISHAIVHLFDDQGNELASASTNMHGYYSMRLYLSTDTYKINATHCHYRPSYTKEIYVNTSEIICTSFYLFNCRTIYSRYLWGR